MLVSFRNKSGDYCRAFAGEELDGIACKSAGAWTIVRTGTASKRPGNTYRQAESELGKLMKEAQNLLVDDPLRIPEEKKASVAK